LAAKSCAASRNPAVPAAGSSTELLIVGLTQSTIAWISERGVKY
jgi:hypothetical protein